MALVDERKIAVLVYLYNHGPSTGYTLAESEEVDYTKGYIYDVLSELTAEGMINEVDREEKGRKRVQYDVSERGVLLLRALDEIESEPK